MRVESGQNVRLAHRPQAYVPCDLSNPSKSRRLDVTVGAPGFSFCELVDDSIAARWRIGRTPTAFGRRIPESVPQGAIATRGARRCHDEHRMVDDEATANWERLDFCS